MLEYREMANRTKLQIKEKHQNVEKREEMEKLGELLRETRIAQFTLVTGQSIVFLLSR